MREPLKQPLEEPEMRRLIHEWHGDRQCSPAADAFRRVPVMEGDVGQIRRPGGVQRKGVGGDGVGRYGVDAGFDHACFKVVRLVLPEASVGEAQTPVICLSVVVETGVGLPDDGVVRDAGVGCELGP